MRALRYFVVEAAASLWRGRRAAVLAVLTIGAGLFILGFFLVVNTHVQRITARWAETAELVAYLRDEASAEEVAAVEAAVRDSGLAAGYEHVTKAQAAERFARDFPDLSATAARLERNPFPASIDVRVRPALRDAETEVAALAATLSALPAVSDVRYDRQWLGRLNRLVRVVRVVGLVVVAMLALAAALTVANVIRLAAHARRDEIEIMQLVGAPFTYVRGPLVIEGVMQGGAGALVAIVALAGVFAAVRTRFGDVAAELAAPGPAAILPVEVAVILLIGGMLLGCVGGLIVARGVR